MKLAVLGASGGCGRWVVQLARERGHEVTAVVREGTSFDSEGAEVAQGNPLDAEFLAEVFRGQDAVACCLGIRRKHPLWPWSAMISPADLTERAAGALVSAMGRCEVLRVVAISAAGVGDSAGTMSWPVRLMIRSSQVGVAYRDLDRMERILEGSELDWLAVRPVTLVGGPPTGRAGSVARYRPWSRISRADVAHFMVDSLERPEPFRERRVLIGRAAPRLSAPYSGAQLP